jgi:anaerobic ribonucleoside-triphosphate reductase
MQGSFRISHFHEVKKVREALKWPPTLTKKFCIAVTLLNVTLESSMSHTEQRNMHRIYRNSRLEFYFIFFGIYKMVQNITFHTFAISSQQH